jgi:hypothetical protein
MVNTSKLVVGRNPMGQDSATDSATVLSMFKFYEIPHLIAACGLNACDLET